MPAPPAPSPDPSREREADRVYHGAVSGADAYRAVRAAVRRDGPVLRIGNRFVPIDRYREIAFLAIGRAAVSAGFALGDALGDALTQGFLAGPDELPERIPFLHRRTRSEAIGTPDNEPVVAASLELAGALQERDLLLVVLSPGALGLLAAPPAGMDRGSYAALVEGMHRSGASAVEVERFVRSTAAGAAGGRLGAAAAPAEVVTLVIDRGGAAESLGGGPTRALTAEEREAARALLHRIRPALSPTDPIRKALDAPSIPPNPGAGRPVVITTPADALQGAGDALSEVHWWSRLGAVTLPGGPVEAARAFSDRVEEVLKGIPRSREKRAGIAVFAGVPLECLDGSGEGEALGPFLETLRAGIRRRTLKIVAFRTAGARPGDAGTPAGIVDASGPGIRELPSFRSGRPGVTDVGPVVAALLPEPEER